MNRVRQMNPRRLIITGILLLLVSAAFLFWARDLVREIFVIPISYLLWLGNVFVMSTDQLFFWYGFAFITFLIAFRSMMARRKPTPLPPGIMEPPREDVSFGRMRYWANRVNLYRRGSSYYQVSFYEALGRMLLELLAYRFHLTPAQVEERLVDNTLQVPPEIRDYALASQTRIDTDNPGRFSKWWQNILHTARGLIAGHTNGSAAQPEMTDPRITRIIEYMEKELEVSHDNFGR